HPGAGQLRARRCARGRGGAGAPGAGAGGGHRASHDGTRRGRWPARGPARGGAVGDVSLRGVRRPGQAGRAEQPPGPAPEGTTGRGGGEELAVAVNQTRVALSQERMQEIRLDLLNLIEVYKD